MRCLALAATWQQLGGQVVFALARSTPDLEARIQREHCAIARVVAIPGSPDDAEQITRIAGSCRAVWVVADGYDFDSNYQRRLKQAGLRLLFVDDFGQAGHYWADIILNQNFYAGRELYSSREPATRLLLGPHYALLREQFKPWRSLERNLAPRASKLLVTLGGADPDNLTLRVIQALQTQEWQARNIETRVVVGGSNPHLDSIRATLSPHSSTIQLLVNVSNMPELMAWAEVAIAAGGITCWELAFMGLPSLVFVLADNQRLVAHTLATAGVLQMTSMDRLPEELSTLLADPQTRSRMSRSGMALVDGGGVARVLAAMLNE